MPDRKREPSPKLELGCSLTYMPDVNLYIYFGGLLKDQIISEESELKMKEIEAREKEELERQSLYYRQDYLRMKKANSADYVYVYDPSNC